MKNNKLLNALTNLKDTLYFIGIHAEAIVTVCIMNFTYSYNSDNLRLLEAIYKIDPDWDRTRRLGMGEYLELILEIKLLGMDPRHLARDIRALENKAKEAQPIREITKLTEIKLNTIK